MSKYIRKDSEEGTLLELLLNQWMSLQKAQILLSLEAMIYSYINYLKWKCLRLKMELLRLKALLENLEKEVRL